jgi:hypothetical protein
MVPSLLLTIDSMAWCRACCCPLLLLLPASTRFRVGATSKAVASLATKWGLDAVERAAVADKLAAALRVPTVSQDPTSERKTDTTKLLAVAALLRNSLVHAALKLTVVNDLYEWRSPPPKGSSPSCSALRHLDVVPVEGSDLSKWLHEPFAGGGAIDDKQSDIG